MGLIVGSRRNEDDNMVVEILLDKDEYRQLRGEVDHVMVFSELIAKVPSRVSLRGRNEATKYFLIPRQLRKRLAVKGKVSCQRVDSTEGKSIFIYIVDPLGGRDAISLDG